MEKNFTMEKGNEFMETMKNSPHVVLLGAGASYACIRNGDKKGKKISCMDNFLQNTGIDIGYTGTNTNLEAIYQEIDDPKKELLEREIKDYFDDFELPDEPTIYDALIISLTKKDLIASFNWDPLLVEACLRCRKITEDLPDIVFLHGNVREWYANNIDGTITKTFAQGKRPSHAICIKTLSGQKCNQTPLLFPVKNKNYSENIYIKNAWNVLQDTLYKAFMFTIFGYSGPKSDEEALMLLKDGFLVKDKNGGTSDTNNFKQLTIIDRNENILSSFKRLLDVPQQPFTEGINDYVKVINDFWNEDNWLITWPRLTTEAYIITQYEGKIPEKWPITINQDNLTWVTLKSMVINQISKEMI
jgi:hypothetical protein